MSLPKWPPGATQAEEAALLAVARDWALSHSLIYRLPLPSPQSPYSSATSFRTSVMHAPFALYPTPFPRECFLQAKHIQKAYNALYSRIACDFDLLEQVIGGNVSKVDAFQGELWKIAKIVRSEGAVQPFHLGLYRSDYLLNHDPSRDTLELQQVEFNTISSSFGALSSKVTQLHRYLSAAQLYPASSNPPILLDNLPENDTLTQLASGLASAHKAYGNVAAQILFVVQDPERNAFDQRGLEWELQERHNISVIRLSFSDLHQCAKLSESRKLLISKGSSHPATFEISVVYFRAGYGPADYPSIAEWQTRLLLERSAAIKCPSVQLQLAGAKKVQQVLASQPEILQKYAGLDSDCDEQSLLLLRSTFTGLYPLDETPAGHQAEESARANPKRYVMKPQREGGGNNVYRDDIPIFLDNLAEEDAKRAGFGQSSKFAAKEGYILMDLISPPQGLHNVLVRASDIAPKLSDVVSELGVYGVSLFCDDGTGQPSAMRMHQNYEAGHLLRTKGRESDEGGVAVGFSVIDSPLLV